MSDKNLKKARPRLEDSRCYDDDIEWRRRVNATNPLPVPPRKAAFIRALAEFLSSDLGRKSIDLQMGKEGAREWAKLRSTTPLFGYQSVDEAIAVLTTFLC